MGMGRRLSGMFPEKKPQKPPKPAKRPVSGVKKKKIVKKPEKENFEEIS